MQTTWTAKISGGPVVSTSGGLDFNAQKEAFEKEFIIKALKTFRWTHQPDCFTREYSEENSLRKIEKYGINAKDYII